MQVFMCKSVCKSVVCISSVFKKVYQYWRFGSVSSSLFCAVLLFDFKNFTLSMGAN